MSFTPPHPPGSPVRAPAVTAKFLAPLPSALFSRDHIATLGQEHLYATIMPAREAVERAAAVPETWAWVKRGAPVPGPLYAIDVETFRVLAGATQRPDGTFDAAGDHGRLVALDGEGDSHVAAVRGWPLPQDPPAHESVPPPAPLPVVPHAALPPESEPLSPVTSVEHAAAPEDATVEA